MTGPALAYAQDTLAELARRPADLVVSSEMLLGVMAAAEAAKRPLAVLSTNVSLFPLPGVPPMGTGLLPARNEAERQQHADFARQARGLFNGGLPALNAARAALGLAPLADVEDQLAAAGRILLGTSRAFDFAPDRLPERVRYVGPQLDEPAWAGGWASPFPANDPRPLLLVAFSTTFQDQGGLVQRVIAALDGLPVRALVTLGPALDPAGLQGAPNVVVAPGAPHDPVMREAAVVVCHGGHGTVMRALTHRLPLLCLPMGRDQDDNAARVTARGAGLYPPRRTRRSGRSGTRYDG